MCGMFSIIGQEEAARPAYFGLYPRQYRGQESAGIFLWNSRKCSAPPHAGMKSVPDVFREKAPIATTYAQVQIAEVPGTGSLRYLSLRGLPCSISCPGDYCTACFHGEPLTPLPEKKSLEYRRRGKASFQTRGQI